MFLLGSFTNLKIAYTEAAAGQVLGASSSLSRQAEQLTNEVNDFVAEARAG